MFSVVFAKAQISQTSFYSMFRTGLPSAQNTFENAFMSGIGVSKISSDQLNFSNPAMLSFLQKTVYSLASKYTYLNTYNSDYSQKAGDFSLSYFGLGFPLGKRAGFSMGLRSHTQVAYGYQRGEEDSERGTIINEGNGGENIMFLSLGYRVFGNFSLGLETDYVFGEINHIYTYRKKGTQYDSRLKNTLVLKGLKVQLGMHYYHTIFKDKYINYGLCFGYDPYFKVDKNHQLYKGFLYSANSERIKEILYQKKTSTKFTKPIKTIIGISINKPFVWHLGLTYSFQNTWNLKDIPDIIRRDDAEFENIYKFALGGYYIPDDQSLMKYFKRITYSGGLFYQKIGINFSGQSVEDMGFSLGFSLPIGARQVSKLNVGMAYHSVGNEYLRESQYVLKVAFTFTDLWFFKRKIN